MLYTYWYFQDEAPYTHRKRVLATSPEWEREMGDQEYKKLLQKYRNDILQPDHRASITVKRVGSRIASAAKKFELEYNSSRSKNPQQNNFGGDYTFTVVRSDMANAFVLPNNHVFLFTGLFRYVREEDELAAVLGHETAHNLARHAGERISGSLLMSILARVTLLLDPSGVLYTLFIPAAQLIHDLPHSRDHEIEADYIGLHLAADACYDPRAARRVFAKMKQDGSRSSLTVGPPEFMSTHPSYDTRLSNFDDWMPDAMAKYNADGGLKCQRIREEMKRARKIAALAASQREQQRR